MKKDKNPNKKLSSSNRRHDKSNDHFQDEDYIVFCLAQDGALDIVQESPTPINTKEEDKKLGEDGIGNGRSYQFQEMENHQTLSGESMESNQSESSKASFSFPVLQWEVVSSPAVMPKSQVRDARKYKVSCARFHCCRF